MRPREDSREEGGVDMIRIGDQVMVVGNIAAIERINNG